jgi:predicted transcriptional regulator
LRVVYNRINGKCIIFLKVGVFSMARANRPYHLTPAEESVMTVFWNSKKAMPQADVIKKAEENGIRNWKERSIFSIINNLLAKGLIQADGFVRAGKTYARTFSATMSRPEYYAKMVAHTLNDKELVVFKRALKAEVNAADAETSGSDEAAENTPAEES